VGRGKKVLVWSVPARFSKRVSGREVSGEEKTYWGSTYSSGQVTLVKVFNWKFDNRVTKGGNSIWKIPPSAGVIPKD